MTSEQVKTLRPGDILKCAKSYINAFFIDQTYYVKTVEDVNEKLDPGNPLFMYLLYHDGHVINWYLKDFELINFFEKM